MLSYSVIARAALESAGFGFSHSKGQNFLFDEELLNSIIDAADIKAGDNVLEVGPGPGIMTALMADRGANVRAYEIDKSLAPVLASVLNDRAEVTFADIMKTDISQVFSEGCKSKDYKIVANLPYYITTDFVLMALSTEHKPKSITLLLQKEAAARLLSGVGDAHWCAAAAITGYFARGRSVFDVPAAAFVPPPHVDSTLVQLEIRSDRIAPPEEEAGFVAFIKTVFMLRRKTLLNALAAYGKENVKKALNALDLGEKTRGETLPLSEMYKLFSLLKEN